MPVTEILRRTAIRKGMLGSSRPWFWIAVVTTSFRLLRRVIGRQEKVVWREELKPGDTLVIAHEREPEVIAPS